METDTLERRLRYAKPQPKDKIISIRERDVRVFEAIHHHGPLPTHYLFELTKSTGESLNAFKHRLTELYNGTLDGKRYLLKPQQQYASFNARHQYLVYDIHRRAELLLAENGRLSPYFRRRNEHWLHQLMAACVSASMQLAITQRGHRYISKSDILTRSTCPESTRQAQNPLALPLSASSEGKYVVPDDLFGIEYAGVKPTYRFMAVEIDRNTESIERTELKQNAFGKKIQGYLDVMRNRTYNQHWGIRNLRMLTVTTNITHLHNLRAFVHKNVGLEFAERFLFKAKPGFGSNWNIPVVMHDLFFEPWIRADGSLVYINQPSLAASTEAKRGREYDNDVVRERLR